MKSASELRHLEQFGIKTLTGEADALGYRILCDLDEQGHKVFCECYGIPRTTQLAENWNSGSIASVMLTGHEVIPLAVMGFYLQGYDVVITGDPRAVDDCVFALETNDVLELNEDCSGYKLNGCKWPAVATVRRIIRHKKSDGKLVSGTRNVHQISGRAD